MTPENFQLTTQVKTRTCSVSTVEHGHNTSTGYKRVHNINNDVSELSQMDPKMDLRSED